ncbi:MAG: hypothetical protein AAGA81_22455 [Acidobacteriota bacterium]
MSIALWLLGALAGSLTVGSLLAVAVALALRHTRDPHEGGGRLEGAPLLAAITGIILLAVVGLIGLQALRRNSLEPILCSWIGDEEALLAQVRDELSASVPPSVYLSSESGGYLADEPERRGAFWVWELPTVSTQVETFSGELIPAFDSAGSVTVFLDPEFDSATSPRAACRLTFHGP